MGQGVPLPPSPGFPPHHQAQVWRGAGRRGQRDGPEAGPGQQPRADGLLNPHQLRVWNPRLRQAVQPGASHDGRAGLPCRCSRCRLGAAAAAGAAAAGWAAAGLLAAGLLVAALLWHPHQQAWRRGCEGPAQLQLRRPARSCCAACRRRRRWRQAGDGAPSRSCRAAAGLQRAQYFPQQLQGCGLGPGEAACSQQRAAPTRTGR